MVIKKTPADEAQVDAEARPESAASEPVEVPAEVSSSDAAPVAPEAANPKPPEVFTPAGWAGKLGRLGKPSGLKVSTRDSKEPQARAERFSLAHSAADQLHGWSAHKLHTADPLLITRDAYEAALAAALTPVTPTDKDGKPTGAPKYRPHAAALSPFSTRGNAQ